MSLLYTALGCQIQVYSTGFVAVFVTVLAKQFTNIWIRKLYQQYIFYYTDMFVYLSPFSQIMQVLWGFFTLISKVEILLCPSKCLEQLGSLERIKFF